MSALADVAVCLLALCGCGRVGFATTTSTLESDASMSKNAGAFDARTGDGSAPLPDGGARDAGAIDGGGVSAGDGGASTTDGGASLTDGGDAPDAGASCGGVGQICCEPSRCAERASYTCTPTPYDADELALCSDTVLDDGFGGSYGMLGAAGTRPNARTGACTCPAGHLANTVDVACISVTTCWAP